MTMDAEKHLIGKLIHVIYIIGFKLNSACIVALSSIAERFKTNQIKQALQSFF